jgi:hypothetical protein
MLLKHLISAAWLTTVLLSGCSSKENVAEAVPRVTNDFENLDGWLADSPALATLNSEKAHSGKYSTKVSAGHDYGLGYSNELSRFSPNWPAKIKIGAWVFVPDEQAVGKLVVEVKAAGSTDASLLWEGVELTKAVKVYNKWQYVEHVITTPVAAKPNSRLLVYLWRAGSNQPLYLDDLVITPISN